MTILEISAGQRGKFLLILHRVGATQAPSIKNRIIPEIRPQTAKPTVSVVMVEMKEQPRTPIEILISINKDLKRRRFDVVGARSADKLQILAKNLRLDKSSVFQNETISETLSEPHQRPFVIDDK